MDRCGRSNIWLYAHPSMKRLAESLIESCDDHVALDEQSLSQRELYARQASAHHLASSRCIEFKDGIVWKKFRDGFPNLFIEDVKLMAGKDIIFLASLHSADVIFEQLCVMYTIPRYMARSFTIILPYFTTGTMERVDTEGQVATAKTLAQLLSGIPLTARGPAQIIVFDIHSLQERFYFSDRVIPRLLSAIPLLQRELKLTDGYDNMAFAFPDEGAFKRFHSMFPDDRTIVCSKLREKDKRVVTVKDGDPRGRHVVIVDDLVMTGGTLIECGKVLLDKGAIAVSAYVTHAVFPQNSWEQFVHRPDEPSLFTNFWITNSIPHAYDIAEHAPFKLLSIGDVIADTMLGYDLFQ